MWDCFDNCVDVLVVYVLVFTVFRIVSFTHIYSYLLLLPPSEKLIAVNNNNSNNNNNNNNNNKFHI